MGWRSQQITIFGYVLADGQSESIDYELLLQHQWSYPKLVQKIFFVFKEADHYLMAGKPQVCCFAKYSSRGSAT